MSKPKVPWSQHSFNDQNLNFNVITLCGEFRFGQMFVGCNRDPVAAGLVWQSRGKARQGGTRGR
jgi:hypothetical protein